MMKKLLTLIVIFGLTGCGMTTDFYYKKGTILANKQKDYDACKIKSFKEVPQNIITTHTPAVHNPGTLSCSNMGYFTNCHPVGAVNIPARSSSHDENEGLRARFVSDCMNKKGYKLVEMPLCNLDEEGYSELEKAPSLDKIKCLDLESPTLQE